MTALMRSGAKTTVLLVSTFGVFVSAGCSGASDTIVATSSGGHASSSTSSSSGGVDRFDVPIEGLSADELAHFYDGDDRFSAPLFDADGLGPLYSRASCGACHEKGLRGPGTVRKMSVVLSDFVTPSPDQSALPYGHTEVLQLSAGAMTPIVAPADPNVRVSTRLGPTILGRGYMEAVAESEIVRLEADQAGRSDNIHGRANRFVYTSEPNPDTRFGAHKKGDPMIGRFGLKARIATLDEFTADALQADMGITSPLRPDELPNPDGLTDDDKPGIDVGEASVNARATYMRLTAIPPRAGATSQGATIFDELRCSVCHVPSLKTRTDYPIAALANIDAPIYSDLLLHDMGPTLADGMVDEDAGSRDWRTPPLIGLRFVATYLHDGRAASVEEAIRAHAGTGSEAAESAALFDALSPERKATLLAFVHAL